MKRLTTILVTLLIALSGFAQAPEKMSYQAVIRDGSNMLVTYTNIGMQISILQGSANGTAVYVERHFPTTDPNGLVALEIGTGTIISGDFTTIDWAESPYFIKTETDLSGGSNYTITGSSQLLSIPYALHAKTAESVTETDPIFGASVASGITETDTDYWNNKQDELTAGTGIELEDDIISATTYEVGDFVQGGVVFWVDETGQHGLVSAKEDQDVSVEWNAGTSPGNNHRAKGDGPFAGEMNTAIIIATCTAVGDDGSDYAAQICADFKTTEGGKTYGDWYLPSKKELDLMYQNKDIIDETAEANGGEEFFPTGYYWSSTWNAWYVNDIAWRQYFYDGTQAGVLANIKARVRAIRAF